MDGRFSNGPVVPPGTNAGTIGTQGFAFQQPLHHQEQVGGSFWRVAVKDVGRDWMTSNRSHVCWGH